MTAYKPAVSFAIVAWLIATTAAAIPILPNDSSQAESRRASQATVQRVQKLVEEKHFDEALQVLAVLEREQPSNRDLIELRGRIFAARGDLASARKSFIRALELNPDSSSAASGLAELDLRDGKPALARQRYEALLTKNGSNVDALLGLAAVAAATHRDAEYIDWLQKAISAQPSSVRPRVLLAEYYLQRGNIRSAAALAKDALTAQPDDPVALSMVGKTQLAAGEVVAALKTYGTLVEKVPDDPAAHYQLATAQISAHDSVSARVSLNAALALKPDHLPSEMALASLELDAKHFTEALAIADRVQRQYPGATAGFGMQGDILLAQDLPDAALKAFERAWQIDKNGFLAAKIHETLSAQGRDAMADQRLLRWLADHPDDLGARGYLAASYTKRHLNKRAIDQYLVVLKTDPDNIVAINDLAWLYQQEKNPHALEMAERGYQLAPENPRILDSLGWILAEQGQTTRALTLLKSAVERAPADDEIRFHFAVALGRSGDKARAREQLQKVLANPDGRFPRGQVEEMLKGL